jgi:hypothetical protein
MEIIFMSFKRFLCVLGLVMASSLAYAEDAPESVKALIPELKAYGTNPVLVAGVKAQNAKGITLDEIKKRDEAWMATSGVDDFMKGIMNNDAAKELSKIEKSKPYFDELFLMDNLGANVAMTNKTSDYWQGDEEKFTNSFKNGAGGLDVGKVKFDKSAQAYLVQVSVPVMDGGKAIGAITFGINIDELEKKK